MEYIADRSVAPVHPRDHGDGLARRDEARAPGGTPGRARRLTLRPGLVVPDAWEATLDSGDMCGICGLMTLDGSSPEPAVLREMSRALADRGPGQRRHRGRRARRPCREAARDHRPRGRRPADRERGRAASASCRTARSTTTASSAGAPARRDTGSRPTATPKFSSHLYEERGLDFVHALRGMFAIALWDARPPPPGPRPRPLRDQAAVLPPGRRRALVRVGVEGAPAAARLRAANRPRCASRLSRVQLDPGADDHLRRMCANSPQATCSSMTADRPALIRVRATEAQCGRRAAVRAAGPARRGGPGPAARLCPGPPRR